MAAHKFFIREEAHKRTLHILRWTSAIQLMSITGYEVFVCVRFFKGQGVDLEVEGMRYIEMHHGPHTC